MPRGSRWPVAEIRDVLTGRYGTVAVAVWLPARPGVQEELVEEDACLPRSRGRLVVRARGVGSLFYDLVIETARVIDTGGHRPGG